MLNNERRSRDDRRNSDGLNAQSPFLTKDGLVFTDRRKRAERRNLNVDDLLEMGEVEEIELKPVRYAQ